jgi:hypothetical protein
MAEPGKTITISPPPVAKATARPARPTISLPHPSINKPAAKPTAPTPMPAAPNASAVPGGQIREAAGGTVAAHSRMLAETVVSTFTQRLKAEAVRHGGQLTIADIDRLSEELQGKRAQLEAVFRQTFEQYVRARERAAFDHARQYPFDRLLVNTFAHLFLPDRAKADGANRVTRRVLPGFFLAIDKMLPPEKLEEFQQRCRDILKGVSSGSEQVMDWQKLYDDAEAKELLIDALAAFAPYFEALEKRKHWFVPLVNDNLQPGEEWHLTDRGFYNLTLAMFAPLQRALMDKRERDILDERFGVSGTLKLHRAVQEITKVALGA